MVRACVLMMAMVGAGVGGCAQKESAQAEHQSVPANNNAAPVYLEVWSDSVRDWLFQNQNAAEDGSQRLPYSFEAADRLIAASQLPSCHFDLDDQHEIDNIFARRLDEYDLSRFLESGTHFSMRDEHPSAAARMIAANLRMLGHFTHDDRRSESRLILHALSAIVRSISMYQESFGEDERSRIAAALAALDADDPSGTADNLRLYAELRSRYLQQQLDGGLLDPARAREAIEYERQITSARAHITTYESGLTSLAKHMVTTSDSDEHAAGKIADWIEEERQLIIRLAEAWIRPDAEESIREIDRYAAEVLYRDYGLMSLVSTPYDGQAQRDHELHTRVRKSLDRVRAWANGETENLELPEETE